MQVSSNKVARAENASLRSELGGLRSQLSETSKQLEAERATSEAPLFPAMKVFSCCTLPSCISRLPQLRLSHVLPSQGNCLSFASHHHAQNSFTLLDPRGSNLFMSVPLLFVLK